MELEVIGAGLGRTGTLSLKLALEHLGFGPCHHMEEVIRDPSRQVPLWNAAIRGEPDWEAVYSGYACAVDWPTAAFWKELASVYPAAKFILTIRDPEQWQESFSKTILPLIQTTEQAPPDVRPFLEMGKGAAAKSGFHADMHGAELLQGYHAHCHTVTQEIPAHRLLALDIRQGWEPLCAFLKIPEPGIPFPNSNSRDEFLKNFANPAVHGQ